MKDGYKKLGAYIRQVDERNKNLSVNRLLGVSNMKVFISSIANTIGTDLSSYKIVHTRQFAYGPVTSRNGDRISVALLTDEDCIISSSYTVFEIIDETKLNADYLMLWFNRPEFDRYVRFRSHGSVREIFDWDELCNVFLPVPAIEEQKELVKAYQTIEKRIVLKKKINDNLRASGIAIVDKMVGSATLINKTQAELNALSLTKGWAITTIADFCAETKSGATPSRTEPTFWNKGTIPWLKSGEVHNGISLKTEEFITQYALENSSTKLLPPDTVLMAMYGVTAGEVGYLAIPSTTNQAVCGMICTSLDDAAYLFFALLQNQEAVSRLSNGGAQDNLSKVFIDSIHLVQPPEEFITSMHLSSIIEEMKLVTREIACLEELKTILLAELSSR